MLLRKRGARAKQPRFTIGVVGSSAQDELDVRPLVCIFVAACGARTELYAGDGGAPPIPDSGPCIFPDITATIMTTTDDQFLVYVNDQQIGGGTDWSQAQQYSVMIHRDPAQRNVVAVQGTNLQNTGGRDRGVLLDMRFVTEAGQQIVVTNAEWRLATSAPANWYATTFDDSTPA